MKLSKEMRVWVAEENNRMVSCALSIAHYKKQIANIRKAIKLERQQISLIKRYIAEALNSWK